MKRLALILFFLPSLCWAQYHIAVADATSLKIPVQAIASSDHLTEKTDVSALTCKKSLNGGTTGDCAGTSAEVSDADQPGTWAYTLHANDVSAAGVLVMRFSATGMDPFRATVQIGNLPADILAINSGATTDYNATLKLKALDISNSAGNAVTLASTGSNGAGLSITGNGSGAGLTATGGATGHGILGTGGATNKSGIVGQGTGSGVGLYAIGGATGAGASYTGGATSGSGFVVTTTDGIGIQVAAGGATRDAMQLRGGGSGDGLDAGGGATGVGMRLGGGGTSGAALAATNATGDVVTVTAAAGNGDGVQLTPHGTGYGLNSTLSATSTIIAGAAGGQRVE